MKDTTRRDFLRKSAALAAVSAAVGNPRALAFDGSKEPRPTQLSQFDYADVQLFEGPMLE